MYDVTLTNDKGVSMCGSDGNFNIDKRLSLHSIQKTVSDYRNRYVKNFPRKAEYWTHFTYRGKMYRIE